MFQRVVFRALFVAPLLAGFAWPARGNVVGTADPAVRNPDASRSAPMRLTAAQTIDGIGGELTFDPALLANPRVEPAAGAAGYSADGYETAPGTFRFIVYRDPPDAAMGLGDPVVDFVFDVPSEPRTTTQAQVHFTSAAAAHAGAGDPATVLSIGVGGPGGTPPPETVAFQDFDMDVTASRAGARPSWRLYE